MPSWDLCCDNDACDAKDSVTCSWKDRDSIVPHHCGRPMVPDMRSYKPVVEVFDSYDTTNIHPEGESIHVRSKTHLRQLENQFGVRRMDDPGMVSRNGEFVKKEKTGTVYIT